MIHLLIFLFFSLSARLFINGLYFICARRYFWSDVRKKNPFLHGRMLKKS